MLHNSSLCDLNKLKSQSIETKLSVLALENEEATLIALNLFVEAMGHELTAFSSATEALDHLDKNNFDIALIDFRLPGEINGKNIIHKIFEADKTTQCFLITGDSAIENDDENITIINKPLTINKLEQIFNTLN